MDSDGGLILSSRSPVQDSRLELQSHPQRPIPVSQVAAKWSDGEPSFFLLRFYEAAARDLTHSARSRQWRRAASSNHGLRSSLQTNPQRRQAMSVVADERASQLRDNPTPLLCRRRSQAVNSARSAADVAASRITRQGFIAHPGFNAAARATPSPAAPGADTYAVVGDTLPAAPVIALPPLEPKISLSDPGSGRGAN